MRGSILHGLGIIFVLFTSSAPSEGGGVPFDGGIDETFQDGGGFVHDAGLDGGRAVAVAPDGRLLIGYTSVLEGTDRDLRLLRVPDQGAATVCGTYHPDLGGTDEDLLTDIAVEGNTVFLAGRAAGPPEDPQPQAAVGAFDLETCMKLPFGGPGGALLPLSVDAVAAAIVPTAQGGVRVASLVGAGTNRHLFSYGLDDTGELDAGVSGVSVSFFTAAGAEFFEPRGMTRQPDGKHLVVGTLQMPDGDRDVGVVRFTAEGSLDSSFSLDGLVSFSYDIVDVGDDEGNAIAVLGDGRIVVGGSDVVAGTSYAAVAVLTPGGGYFNDFGVVGRYRFHYDTGFFPGSTVQALATQGDGKIVAVGVAMVNFHFYWGVARLGATGDAPLDSSFGFDGRTYVAFAEGGSNDALPTDVTLGQGGRISIVGSATSGSGPVIAAARLWNSYIFADGFESGSRYYWSASQP